MYRDTAPATETFPCRQACTFCLRSIAGSTIQINGRTDFDNGLEHDEYMCGGAISAFMLWTQLSKLHVHGALNIHMF